MQDLAFSELLEHLKNLSYSPYIHFFFWLMILDIVTGYIKAFKTKRFDSKVGTMLLIPFFSVFVVILLVAMYARSLGFRSFGIAWTMFFSFNYLFSVIENWEMIGLAFPEVLKPYINQIKKDNARKLGQFLINIDQKDKVELEIKEENDDE